MAFATRAAALGLLLLGLGAADGAAAGAPPDDGNGVIGMLGGEGGDPAFGGQLYGKRCASCHDHVVDRIPSKALISENTRAFIATTLFTGIMQPMAQGLSPHEIASIAAYLSTREPGTVSGAGPEAPLCKNKPETIDLQTADQWNGWGRTDEQPRYQPDPGFTAADVPRLKLKWAFAYANARGGQATVVGDHLFLNASTGAVYALNAKTGCAYWRFDAPAPTRSTLVAGVLSTAPSHTAIYFTDYTRSTYALDADSGALVWKTQVDDQREVQMTGSPTLHDGLLFVPISSAEEAIAANPTYPCCKFRGAVAALDAGTGKLLWTTYVTPEPAQPFKLNTAGVQMFGPAGGAIWSAPTSTTSVTFSTLPPVTPTPIAPFPTLRPFLRWTSGPGRSNGPINSRLTTPISRVATALALAPTARRNLGLTMILARRPFSKHRRTAAGCCWPDRSQARPTRLIPITTVTSSGSGG